MPSAGDAWPRLDAKVSAHIDASVNIRAHARGVVLTALPNGTLRETRIITRYRVPLRHRKKCKQIVDVFVLKQIVHAFALLFLLHRMT